MATEPVDWISKPMEWEWFGRRAHSIIQTPTHNNHNTHTSLAREHICTCAHHWRRRRRRYYVRHTFWCLKPPIILRDGFIFQHIKFGVVIDTYIDCKSTPFHIYWEISAFTHALHACSIHGIFQSEDLNFYCCMSRKAKLEWCQFISYCRVWVGKIRIE